MHGLAPYLGDASGNYAAINNLDRFRENEFYGTWRDSMSKGPIDMINLHHSNGLSGPYSAYFYPFQWENNFYLDYTAFARSHWWFAYVLAFVYCVLVKIVAPRVMGEPVSSAAKQATSGVAKEEAAQEKAVESAKAGEGSTCEKEWIKDSEENTKKDPDSSPCIGRPADEFGSGTVSETSIRKPINDAPAFTKTRWFKNLLSSWNLILAVFSLCGAIRTVPQVMSLLFYYGAGTIVCHRADLMYGYGPAGFWTMLFIHSKYIEFGDTVFLILKKKPVSLLHWYHHASVLLYCWDALMWQSPSGIVFVAMNYSVHSVMYFYYFLTSRGIFPKWGHWVTKFQISQMVVGMATVLLHLYMRAHYRNCDGSRANLIFAGLMYLSYFLLFAQFYVKRYNKAKKSNGDNKEAIETKKAQ